MVKRPRTVAIGSNICQAVVSQISYKALGVLNYALGLHNIHYRTQRCSGFICA